MLCDHSCLLQLLFCHEFMTADRIHATLELVHRLDFSKNFFQIALSQRQVGIREEVESFQGPRFYKPHILHHELESPARKCSSQTQKQSRISKAWNSICKSESGRVISWHLVRACRFSVVTLQNLQWISVVLKNVQKLCTVFLVYLESAFQI